MGRKLTTEERRERIARKVMLASICIRPLGGPGVCQGCESKISKGDYSFRYDTLRFGREVTVGCCMGCAIPIMELIEKMVSGTLAKARDAAAGKLGDVPPELEPKKQKRSKKPKKSAKPDPGGEGDPEPPVNPMDGIINNMLIR
jgi:hypothetical protein